MTHSRSREKSNTAVNHRTNSPKSPENSTLPPITKTITKSAESHRLFTLSDEIALLKTLSQSPNSNELRTGNFTEAQIANKLKKLKEKYHKLARSKSQIKTPHDGEIYEIGRKIWGRNAAKGKELLVVVGEEDHDEDEDVNLDDFSFLVNEMTMVFQRNEYCKQGLRKLGKKKLMEMNEKWMELKLKESELMMNKTQLYHENLKVVVEGSKGSNSSN
ncbi:probable transcription factor At1g61730 [Solanum lycopersicum]|uniref:Glabrous enhancer-binding protein-like DBD domain-containing protein n=1 Tax=Solanum lycopersicum TaxID=4081 RepID=A0A3Q7IZ76_SOLLC